LNNNIYCYSVLFTINSGNTIATTTSPTNDLAELWQSTLSQIVYDKLGDSEPLVHLRFDEILSLCAQFRLKLLTAAYQLSDSRALKGRVTDENSVYPLWFLETATAQPTKKNPRPDSYQHLTNAFATLKETIENEEPNLLLAFIAFDKAWGKAILCWNNLLASPSVPRDKK